MIPISLWGCSWLPHSSTEWKISWLLASLNAAPNYFVAQRPMGLDSRPERRPGEYRFKLKVKLLSCSPLFLILNARLEQCFLTGTNCYFCDPAPAKNSPTQFLLASEWQVWHSLTHIHTENSSCVMDNSNSCSCQQKPRHCSGFDPFTPKFLQFWQHRAVSPVLEQFVESQLS